MNNKKKVEVKENGVNPVVAVVTGALVGAGVIAGAVVLSDKKNREKIGNAVNNAKEQAANKFEEVKGQTVSKFEEVKKQTHEKVVEGTKDAKVATAMNDNNNTEREKQALAEVKDKSVNYYTDDIPA